jgi:hypothetical protein
MPYHDLMNALYPPAPAPAEAGGSSPPAGDTTLLGKTEAPAKPQGLIDQLYPVKPSHTEDPSRSPVELKLPEGWDAKHTGLTEFREAAAEAGLDSKKAQRLFDMHAKAVGELAAAGTERERAADAEVSSWAAKTKADPEFGGERLEATRGAVGELLKEFGTDGTRELFSGPIGDHPEMVRLLVRVGRALQNARGR